MTRLILKHLLIGCILALSTAAEAQVARPTHYIIGFDRSASRTPQQMHDMAEFVRQLTPLFEFGDAVDYMAMLRSDTDEVTEQRGTIQLPRDPARPLRRDLAIRDAMRQLFQQNASQFTSPTGQRPKSTDILGFLRRAGAYLRSDTGRRGVIFILSDMLHSVPGLDFEQGVIPGDAWFAVQKRDGLLPKLSGACIVAVGAAEGTPLASRVRQFWMRYAKETDAVLKTEHYQRFLEPAAVNCPL